MRDPWHLVDRTSSVIEDDYFPALADALAETTEARMALVLDATGTRTVLLAGSACGRRLDTLEIDASGTPLARVHAGEPGVRLQGPLRLGSLEVHEGEELLAVTAVSPATTTRAVVCLVGLPASLDRVPASRLEPFAVRVVAEIDATARSARQREVTAERMRYAATLLELAPLRFETFEQHLHTILERTAKALAVERTSYWSLVDDGDAIECEQLFVRSRSEFERGHRLDGRRYPSYFAALKTCHVIDAGDAAVDSRTSELSVGYFDRHGISSMLDVPVWQEGRLAGVICLEHVGPIRSWSPDAVAFASSIAQSVSIALETAARSRAEERYRLVAGAVGEVIWDLAVEDGTIERAGLGYEAATRATLAWWESKLHPDDRERVAASFKAACEGSATSWTEEYRFIREDGSIAFVRDHGLIVRNAAGRAVRAVGAMQDITERRELEQRLALSDRMASVGTLAAGVAHEINNPLFYVLGNIDVAIAEHEALGIEPDVLDALREARQGAVRIAEIVRSMRVFARTDLVTSNAVDVDAVVNAALNMAMNEIRHRARLVKHLGAPPLAAANETRLVQVVLNLLVNAAQSIPEGSADLDEVRVTTGVAPGGEISIEVSDTGSGMSPETLSRIFDPFFTTKGVGHGMGLGLSIVHSIVTSFGGEISVSSTQGKGSTFRVLLPRATPASLLPRPSTAPDVRRSRVLIVEDERALARALRRMLGADHEIVVAEGGRHALEVLAADPHFDVVLCDVMMPDLTGADLHREVSGRSPELGRRFVFMSGGAFGAQARSYVDATGQPMLAKPFDRRQLSRALAALETQRSRAT